MKNHTMIQHWMLLTVAVFGIGALLLCVSNISADEPIAPLNGTVSFQNASASNDTLKVNAGSKTIRATQAMKIQGHPDSEITVIGTAGSGPAVPVANVIKRDGESLYRVRGAYDGGGGGGGSPDSWHANYNRGGGRIILEVNPGYPTNTIPPTTNGGTLRVTLTNVPSVSQNTPYTVSLSQISGNGAVAFPTNTVTFTGPGSRTVNLTGVTPGDVKIKGTCTSSHTGIADGEVDAIVGRSILEEVTFDVASGTRHDMYPDGIDTIYPTPHWLKGRTAPQSPICYERNSKMKATVKFSMVAGASGSVKVYGVSSGFRFLSKDATISSGTVTVSNWEANNAFPNTVDILDPLDVTWYTSFDGGQSWEMAGESSNQAYVILGTPATGAQPHPTDPTAGIFAKVKMYHTLVHVGCKNAKGQSTPNGTKDAIWKAFATPPQNPLTGGDFRRVDGVRLTYYANYKIGHVWTKGLLANGDGQCGAWTMLFLDMLKAHGISNTGNYILFKPKDNPSHGFFVKNWTIPAAGGINKNNAKYPFVNTQDTRNGWPLQNSYPWLYAQVTDPRTGIPGQGNANPASRFNNHQIAKLADGKYYDPSYGIIYNNFAAIKGAAIEGFHIPGALNEKDVNVDLNGDKNITDVVVPCWFIGNANADNLEESASNR